MSQGNSLRNYFKHVKLPFFLNTKTGQKEKTSIFWGLEPVGGRGY
jgi:hypothetical protein